MLADESRSDFAVAPALTASAHSDIPWLSRFRAVVVWWVEQLA